MAATVVCMSKRTLRTLRGGLWIIALVLCCLSAVMLAKANRPIELIGVRRPSVDPTATGTIERDPIRWCGAAWWCR
jgi:hypothetical protein